MQPALERCKQSGIHFVRCHLHAPETRARPLLLLSCAPLQKRQAQLALPCAHIQQTAIFLRIRCGVRREQLCHELRHGRWHHKLAELLGMSNARFSLDVMHREEQSIAAICP